MQLIHDSPPTVAQIFSQSGGSGLAGSNELSQRALEQVLLNHMNQDQNVGEAQHRSSRESSFSREDECFSGQKEFTELVEDRVQKLFDMLPVSPNWGEWHDKAATLFRKLQQCSHKLVGAVIYDIANTYKQQALFNEVVPDSEEGHEVEAALYGLDTFFDDMKFEEQQ